MYHLCTTATFPAIHHKRKILNIRLNIKDFPSVGVTGFEPATTRPPQMMFNVQILGGGWEGNGGDGWLRILEFLPDGRTIKVRTYSPLFGISSLTKHLAHRTGACDRFDMVIE